MIRDFFFKDLFCTFAGFNRNKVDITKQFDIQFSGLGLGTHTFEYDLDNQYFESFEYSDMRSGEVKVRLDLDRQERMMVLEFSFEGLVEVMCDRCADYYHQKVSGNEKLIIKVVAEPEEDTEDIVYISESQYMINVSHYIYEFIELSLPMRRIHPETGDEICNQETLEKLEQIRITEEIDPRWEALKNMNSN